MRVIEVREFGGPEVLVQREAPDPAAGPGEVVVKVAAADVIFLDTLLRGGWGKDMFPIRPPYVPGNGGTGTVLSVGADVDPGWVGRRVLGRMSGGYAERATAAVADLVPVPDGLGLPEAAALLHDGPTALGLLELAGVQKGEWVLVAAAAGGAGSIAVQLARDTGARVIAAARGERKLSLARELGAEVAVDYSEPGWEQRVRAAAGGAGVDVVLDGAGGRLGAAAFTAVADGGRFVTYGTADGFAEIDPQEAERRRVTVANPLTDETDEPASVGRERTERALALAAEGRIRPAIGATYPLERAADAHTSLAERTTVGKSLLLP
ncbi:NADPH2:quinone reductase [Murinocardiopsis flavida]|uniref:NADPH2:quinone reductase n=1 Tax=Murinocardiopsis flavida TaxID=645275 RepID=A0A2P8CWM4_9ACTN|nr:zinc-binding dehydrogenase [Murinocardiopsis flavida]PSK89383.1 NADPH2:quinone reductase [Murinocardiopsis flavida]